MRVHKSDCIYYMQLLFTNYPTYMFAGTLAVLANVSRLVSVGGFDFGMLVPLSPSDWIEDSSPKSFFNLALALAESSLTLGSLGRSSISMTRYPTSFFA